MKVKYFSIIIISIITLFFGCQTQNNEVDSIIEKAYNYIQSQEEKESIIDWKNSKYTEHDYSIEQQIHRVWNIETNKEVDLNGKQVYKVVFKVKDSSILGDINIYIDKRTDEVLGVDLRE